MLLHLSVENYILIQKLELDFKTGFTCITGETGAGKSILVGALGILLGQRADTQVLKQKDRKCIVEGVFRLEGYGLEPLFDAADLDFEVNTIFRREINPQGKSRAFINDTPVNLSVMKEIGDRLVDIHSQNQTLELNGAAFQLEMVDSYSLISEERSAYAGLYSSFQLLKKELEESVAREDQLQADQEYTRFQLDEITAASLVPGEQSEAEEELELLTHAEEIKSRLFAAVQLLDESESSVLARFSEARQSIEAAARFAGQLEPLNDRLNSIYIDLKEISREINNYSSHIQHDPERTSYLSARLDLIYHLEQKHKRTTVEELLALADQLNSKLNEMESLEERIIVMRREIEEIESELAAKALHLEEMRRKALPVIEQDLEKVLKELGMPAARFSVKMEHLDHFTPTGKNKITFMFAANSGSELREISKVASGGELSRLMLAIKSLIIKQSMLPTILFDEIDAGVSGEIAGKMGQIMHRMAGKLQVISITHLPQIAAKADHHILATKEDLAGGTISNLEFLNGEKRVNEIARMLSDDVITDTSRAAAREMMHLN